MKLGQTFEDTLSAVTNGHFEPIGMRECLNDLPLRGCGIYEPASELAIERKDGIPYHRSLSFNRLGRLTDIGLRFVKEGGVTSTECLDVHGRTLDWLTREYGSFAQRPTTEKHERRKSSGGITFEMSAPIEEGSFIVPHARNVAATSPVQRQRPVARWDDKRYVSLFSSFIVVGGKASCDVSVDFSEPLTVERAKPAPPPPVLSGVERKEGLEEAEDVPVCDRPDSPEKFALMNEIGVDCTGE